MAPVSAMTSGNRSSLRYSKIHPMASSGPAMKPSSDIALLTTTLPVPERSSLMTVRPEAGPQLIGLTDPGLDSRAGSGWRARPGMHGVGRGLAPRVVEVTQVDLDPECELIIGGEAIGRDSDPARSHRTVGPHDRGPGTGNGEELVAPSGIHADQQAAVSAGRDDHAVVHHERQAAE